MKVGFVGLGIMGAEMARHIYNGGFPLTVWNRTSSKSMKAEKWGANVADTLNDLASKADVIITCVGDTNDVAQVLTGSEGLLKKSSSGKIIIDMSTISPDATREFYKLAREMDIDYLDAPVTGGDIGAKNGTLSIMVGGDLQVLVKVKPVLQAMASSITYCGSIGSGQTVKACNQIMCALNLLGVIEALTLAKKSGIDLEKVVEVTKNGAGSSWALNNLGPRICKGDYKPGFSVKFQQKDLRIVLNEAERLMLPLMGTSLVNQLLRSLEAYGFNEDGTHALMHVIGNLSNTKLTPSDE